MAQQLLSTDCVPGPVLASGAQWITNKILFLALLESQLPHTYHWNRKRSVKWWFCLEQWQREGKGPPEPQIGLIWQVQGVEPMALGAAWGQMLFPTLPWPLRARPSSPVTSSASLGHVLHTTVHPSIPASPLKREERPRLNDTWAPGLIGWSTWSGGGRGGAALKASPLLSSAETTPEPRAMRIPFWAGGRLAKIWGAHLLTHCC